MTEWYPQSTFECWIARNEWSFFNCAETDLPKRRTNRELHFSAAKWSPPDAPIVLLWRAMQIRKKSSESRFQREVPTQFPTMSRRAFSKPFRASDSSLLTLWKTVFVLSIRFSFRKDLGGQRSPLDNLAPQNIFERYCIGPIHLFLSDFTSQWRQYLTLSLCRTVFFGTTPLNEIRPLSLSSI